MFDDNKIKDMATEVPVKSPSLPISSD